MATSSQLHKEAMKAAILAGETYAAVGKRFNCDGRQVYRILVNDPDIVKAKAAGDLRPRSAKLTAETALQDPAVADVILNGMTVNAAAKKHGIAQPVLWLRVSKVKAQMNPTPTEDDLNKVADMLRKAAKRLNMRPEALAHDMIHRLAD